MITILDRYIGKTIALATGLAALIIGGVLFLMALLGEAKNIGEGDYGLAQVMLYVLIRMPSDLYQFSPLLVLLGSIVGLSVLTSSRELAVMRTAGFSVRRIICSVLFSSLLLILLMSIVGEWLGTSLSYTAIVGKENAKHAGQAVVTATGIWYHIDHNFIHVQRVVGRQLLKGVTRYQFDDEHHLQAAYYANSLFLQDHQWWMKDVVKTSFYHDRTKSQTYPLVKWDLRFNTNLLSVNLVDPSEMSLTKLASFAHYLQQNGLQAGAYQFSFWQRVLQPVASLIMVFLAVPFVLGAFTTSTMGWRVIMGTLVGFVFFILNATLGQLSIVYQIPPIVSALLPLVLFAGIGVWLSNRLIRY